MAARVDQEIARLLGVSATVVQATAAEHLTELTHVVWTDAPGGQQRKEYTAAGRALLLSLLAPPPKNFVEKSGAIRLPGDGFTLWTRTVAKTPPERLEAKEDAVGAADAEKPASEPQRTAARHLMIVRIFPNPIWVLVKTPDGKTAEVRVRHSRLLVPGKPLLCSPAPAGGWKCADPLLAINPVCK